jgi:hypothetical protein
MPWASLSPAGCTTGIGERVEQAGDILDHHRGKPGQEIEGPMAMVILAGLVTSTVLSLLVLPTLVLRYGRFETTETDR